MTTTRHTLQEMRKGIVEKLRTREPELMRELDSIDLALENLGSESFSPGIYTPIKMAIDALTAHLDRIQHTEDKNTLAAAIIQGGWLKGHPRAEQNAKGSITFHIDNSDKTKRIRRFPSGKIGLYNWPDERDQHLK